jgi:NDP-sugar pyrophosphorylase family protein
VLARPAPSTAFVLTAGLGTRLRPLTRDRAKPALPVAGVTLVERIIAALLDYGLHDVLLNLHYCPQTITAIVGDGAATGQRARYSWEVPLLGSAGGPRRAFELVPDDRLWLINGDTLSDVPLDAMAGEHMASDALVTMALIPNPAPQHYGGVLMDDAGAITSFTHRGSEGPSWHFVGVQIAERAAFSSLQDGVPANSVGGLYPRLIAARPGSVRGFPCRTSFLDIGTPRDYLDACLALAGPSRLAHGARVQLHGTAHVEDCVLWDDVTVGSGVRLRRVVVGDRVHVPEGFQAEECVLLKSAGDMLEQVNL